MSIEAFQIASAVFAGTTIGFAHLSYGLRLKLKESMGHVANLQKALHEAYDTQDDMERQRSEVMKRLVALEKFEARVSNQRKNALRVAAERRKLRAAGKSDAEITAEMQRATQLRTYEALQAAPLRPRDEVVANIRSSKAAQEQLSSAN